MVKERMDLLELLRKGGMDGDVDFLSRELHFTSAGRGDQWMRRCHRVIGC